MSFIVIRWLCDIRVFRNCHPPHSDQAEMVQFDWCVFIWYMCEQKCANDHYYFTLSYYCIIHFVSQFFSVFLFSIRLNALCSEPNAFRVQFTHIFLAPLTVLSLMSRDNVMCERWDRDAHRKVKSMHKLLSQTTSVCMCSGADAHSHVWHLLLHIVRLCHFHIPRHRHAKWFTAFRRPMPILPILRSLTNAFDMSCDLMKS